MTNLPYQLSAGVTATEAGLVLDGENAPVLESLVMDWPGSKSGMFGTIIPWVTVADRLRYRESEPWCGSEGRGLYCGTEPLISSLLRERALHRLAAILCDDAESFRILHACIKESE